METEALLRAAAISAIVALVSLVVSAIALGLFFGGAGRAYGPINDFFSAVTLFALILPMLAVDRLVGPAAGTWLRVVTVAGIAGAVLAASGQLLLIVGVIDLRVSFVTGGLGFLPVLVWIVATAVLGLPMHVLPAPVGWLAAGVVAMIVVASAITIVTTGPPAWVAWGAVTVLLAAWLGALGATFLGAAAA